MEWNIQTRSSACQECQKAFVEKEEFHTLLTETKLGYERLDLCQGCWTKRTIEPPLETQTVVSHWQTQYQPPPATPPDPIQKETAETLLRKLLQQNDPSHAAARYILAAMLERKRILKVKAQLSRDGQRVFVYEHPKTGDLFQIPDPNLQLQQLEAVQHDVLHLLQHGLPSDKESVPAAPSSGQNAPAEVVPAAPDVPVPAPAPA